MINNEKHLNNKSKISKYNYEVQKITIKKRMHTNTFSKKQIKAM